MLYILIVLFSSPLFCEPMYSPTWGFAIDLPEGFEYTDGDSVSRFSFDGPQDTRLDIAVYKDTYTSLENMVNDVNFRLKNQGDTSFFDYHGKAAALMEIQFDNYSGWGLCTELESKSGGAPPLMVALAYGTAGQKNTDIYLLSALDSIIPSNSERRYPGPITEFGYPRGELTQVSIANTDLKAQIRENDAEAAQALVDREYKLLTNYAMQDNWKEAWIRFYRAIYRDSWDRLADAAFQLERTWWNVSLGDSQTGTGGGREFAQKALSWVQGFTYTRNLAGSDFENLVSAFIDGKGDCDSRAMLWAIILAQANIPAAIMVSQEHSHAMGLADVEGQGARFEASGTKWLVAETTAKVDIGLIAQEQSAIESWIAVVFE